MPMFWTLLTFRRLASLLLASVSLLLCGFSVSRGFSERYAPYHVLAFYTDQGEPDHIDFARQALGFFGNFAKQNNFQFQSRRAGKI